METASATGITKNLPGRPWMLAADETPFLISLQGQTLVPIFRTAEACRRFMESGTAGLSPAFYPQFPEEDEFVALLSAAMRSGAEGYILIDADRWSVIGFVSVSKNFTVESNAAYTTAIGGV